MVMPMNFSGMGYGSTGNVYQNLKSQYGCGYVDYAERPKVAGYPVEINPQPHYAHVRHSWLSRFISKFNK